MANAKADLATAASAVPPTRVKTNQLHGRVRVFQASITVAVAIAIGETITWGDLPVGARPLGHLGQLSFSAGAASSTINLGDAASAARHLAATSVTAAGAAVPQAATAAGAQFATSDGSTAATNNCTLISTVAGAAVPIGQVLTLTMPYVVD